MYPEPYAWPDLYVSVAEKSEKVQRNHQLQGGQPLIWLFTCENNKQ